MELQTKVHKNHHFLLITILEKLTYHHQECDSEWNSHLTTTTTIQNKQSEIQVNWSAQSWLSKMGQHWRWRWWGEGVANIFSVGVLDRSRERASWIQ